LQQPAFRCQTSGKEIDMSEVPLFPWWVTVLLTIWALIGPLAGLLIGHYLVRSWERRRWLADNRKEEYRRLLTALNKLNILTIDWHRSDLSDRAAKVQPIKETLDEASMAFNTSLFITDFLEQSKVAGDLIAMSKKLVNGGSFDDYHKEYWRVVNLILGAAKKSAL
jgi:hypothetical protein